MGNSIWLLRPLKTRKSLKTKLKIGDPIIPAGGAKATITTDMRDLVAMDGDPGLPFGAASYYAQAGGAPYAQQYIGGAGLCRLTRGILQRFGQTNSR